MLMVVMSVGAMFSKACALSHLITVASCKQTEQFRPTLAFDMVPWKAWVHIDWLKYQYPVVDLTITKTNPEPLLGHTVLYAWPHWHCHQSSGDRVGVWDLLSQVVAQQAQNTHAWTMHRAASLRKLQDHKQTRTYVRKGTNCLPHGSSVSRSPEMIMDIGNKTNTFVFK
jgi:hypothetical protein